MDHTTVACVQQRMSIHPTQEEFQAEAHRFLRQAQAKSARIILFPELAGLMLAPPLISGLKLGFIKQEDQSKQPGASLVARALGRVAGSTAGVLGGGFWGSLERLIRKKSSAFLDAYLTCFGGFARQYGMIVVGGSLYLEDPETGEVRCRSYVFDTDGHVLGYQDKFHLAAGEESLARPGTDLTVIDTRQGRLGLLLGRDSLYPELARLLTLQDADLIAGLAASPGTAQGRVIRSALALRAEENQVFTAAAFLLGPNYVDRGPREDFYGRSALMAPISLTPKGDGVLIEAGTDRTEALIAAEINMDDLRALRQSSRFRPRQQIHLGNMVPLLVDFYGQGLSMEEAIAQDLAGLGKPISEPDLEAVEAVAPDVELPFIEAPFIEAPDVEAPDVEAPDVEGPDVEAPTAEPPEPPEEMAEDLPVPEAMSPTSQRNEEESHTEEQD
jgi:predicted amidohydrolase